MTTLYRVEQSEHERDRMPLTGATIHDAAKTHMMSIAENMMANGWYRTDRDNVKKLATAVILTNDVRTVTLAVVECDESEFTGTKIELRQMEWLTRPVPCEPHFGVQVVDIDQTQSDALFADELEGYDVVSEEARNG